uniref:Uncharacterized protein n=1 Tax=Peronospora matthiolae TaxID=2874970 RepID=A0AAV1U8N8_9STRA
MDDHLAHSNDDVPDKILDYTSNRESLGLVHPPASSVSEATASTSSVGNYWGSALCRH